ncbi:type II toxin-antitoxin system HicA family toxin [Novosphingobium lentum]|uniref:type II toxin-antitoxin system HicA family toxin n=1 Tax=Novosphingobium lentum TaxID=145287 RepID=UPI0008347DE8|nr:type II toxin-antitoxin system HicA family toxin [Novosphingobium lentum]
MTQIEKLFSQLVATRAAMRFADFERILKAFGFTLDRINGSHHIYKHPVVPRRLSIQPRGGKAKPYQIDQFLDMVEEFGLEMKK